MSAKTIKVVIAGIALCGALSGQVASADQASWTGNGSGNWRDNGNWTGASGGGTTVPSATDTALFSGALTSKQPLVTGGTATIAGITFGSTSGWTITVNDGRTLSLGNGLTVGSVTNVGIDATALTSGSDNLSSQGGQYQQWYSSAVGGPNLAGGHGRDAERGPGGFRQHPYGWRWHE